MSECFLWFSIQKILEDTPGSSTIQAEEKSFEKSFSTGECSRIKSKESAGTMIGLEVLELKREAWQAEIKYRKLEHGKNY